MRMTNLVVANCLVTFNFFKVVKSELYNIQCSAQVFKRAGCHLKRAL